YPVYAQPPFIEEAVEHTPGECTVRATALQAEIDKHGVARLADASSLRFLRGDERPRGSIVALILSATRWLRSDRRLALPVWTLVQLVVALVAVHPMGELSRSSWTM